MIRLVSRRLAGLLLAAGLLFGLPSLARADFVLVLSDGTNTQMVASSSGVSIFFSSTNWNGYRITVSADLTMDATANFSELFNYTLDAKRTTANAGETLSVYLGITNVGIPVGDTVVVSSTMSVNINSLNPPGGQLFSYSSFVDDNEANQIDATATPLAGYTAVGSVSNTLGGEIGSFDTENASAMILKDGEFALATRTTLTLSAGVSASVQGTTVLATPEPGTMLLGLMGGLSLCASTWVRRRRQVTV